MSNKRDFENPLCKRALTQQLIEQAVDLVETILKVVLMPDYDTEAKDEPRQDMGYAYPVDGENRVPV